MNFSLLHAENYEGMKKILIIILGLFITVFLGAEVRFSGLDLAESNKMLFTASVDSPATGSYSTLLRGDLKTGNLTQLTFFPEEALYLRETGQLQIQNRFGVFRSDSSLSSIQPVKSFDAFVSGKQIQTGKINPSKASPDGKWLVYLRPHSYGYAELYIYNAVKQKEILIAENVSFSLEDPPVLWAPDSQFFVYSKQNELFYYSIEQLDDKRVISEEYRKIGNGRINNAHWNSQNNLYYIDGFLIYQIFSAELFTHSIYSELLQIGTIIGKIPFLFDPNFDNFWISPDGTRILLNKGGRNIFMYGLSVEDYLTTEDSSSLPYLYLPQNTVIKDVIWPDRGTVTLLTGSILHGSGTTAVYRLQTDEETGVSYFTRTEDEGINALELSLNEEKIALVHEDRIVIKSYKDWKTQKTLSFNSARSCIWKNDEEIILPGKYTTVLINLISGKKRFIAYSQPGKYGFSKSSRKIIIDLDGNIRSYNEKSSSWDTAETFDPGSVKMYTTEYRVYLELLEGGSYRNMVMVRDAVGYGTKQLFNGPVRKYEPFPVLDDPVDFTNFTHGSRIRRREVALVFNAVDNVEGLTDILNTLAEYDLRCTFFINGEFIRRHPAAVREIAESGHEIGSLFYVHFNMTDATFQMDDEFIKRGLARNEDDYFKITGRELSLLWHTPYYFVNSEIIESAGEMNYLYVGRDVDSLDWVTREQALQSAGIYMPTGQLIERIIKKKKPGSIISIRIGQTEGQREDYIFHHLDVLLNGLLSLGYSVVPASELIEHAK